MLGRRRHASANLSRRVSLLMGLALAAGLPIEIVGETQEPIGINTQETAHLANVEEIWLNLSALVSRVAVFLHVERLGEGACSLETGFKA
jgi:hypothetical protein